MLLERTVAKAVTDEYDVERVAFVLANTVQYKDYDGRFSQSNKEWAAGFTVPENDTNIRSSFVVDHHPVIINEFITHARKPSTLGQLQDGKKAVVQSTEPQNAH